MLKRIRNGRKAFSGLGKAGIVHLSKRQENKYYERGFILISVLAMLSLLASIAAVTQQVAVSELRVLHAVSMSSRASLARQSTASLARIMVGLRAGNESSLLGGRTIEVKLEDETFKFALQDVDALPDLFSSPIQVFDFAFAENGGIDGNVVAAFRANYEREQVFSVKQALVLSGVKPSQQNADLLTIFASNPKLNISNASSNPAISYTSIPRFFLSRFPERVIRLRILSIEKE